MLSDRYARLGENGSPKRGHNETWCVSLFNPHPSEELCVLSDIRSHSGKKSSPKRDDVIHPLFHARSGEVG